MGRELTQDEHRYYMAFLPISAFYWFCWGLYKGSVGDDDSFFFLPSYRNLVRFIDQALESYKAEGDNVGGHKVEDDNVKDDNAAGHKGGEAR